MAFFSGLSSTIGRKLLLYGLRQIDILDKDPADFVSVNVGKRTTLEVRDVGLHIKVRKNNSTTCPYRTERML
jgi:autophagy-related protein 2